MKHYNSYKDSGENWIGDIPKHWVKKKLGYSIDTIVPMRDKPTSLNGDIPWIRIEDYTGKYIYGSKSNQGVSQDLIDEMNLKIYPIDTVLTTCSCSFGTTMIVKRPLTSNQTFIGLVPNKTELNEEFLYYQLQIWEEELDRLSSGSIQKYLSRDNFKSLRFLFPPISEQIAIVAFLDKKTQKISNLIQHKKRKIKLLKEKRTALINHAVTKGLDPNVEMKDSGVEWIGEIPEHWDLTKVKHEFIISGGGTPSKDNMEYWNGDIPWVSPKDMKSKEISKTEDYITSEGIANSSTKLISETSLLMVVRSGILQHSIPVCFNTLPVTINQDLKSFISKKKMSVSFFYYLIKGYEKNLLLEWSKEGTTVESIEMEFMLNSKIQVPNTRSEQQHIVEYLDGQTNEIDELIQLEQKKIDLLKEYRQSLISEVVTGKIRVCEEDHSLMEQTA